MTSAGVVVKRSRSAGRPRSPSAPGAARWPGTSPGPRPASRRPRPRPPAPAPGIERRDRRPVDGRVLADLERREVEPERPDLPAQVRELAVGHATEPVGDERIAGRRPAPGRARPGPRSRRSSGAGLARERRPRPADALRDRTPKPLAVRLVREAPPELAHRSRGAPPRRARARGRARGPCGRGRRARRSSASAGRDRLVAAQHVVGLDPQRRSVISPVTPGLPSRSPPIHDPSRSTAGRAAGGSRSGRLSRAAERGVRPSTRGPARGRGALEAGPTVNSVSSKNAIAERTSSSGVGATERTSDVCHSRLISSRSRRRRSASSAGVRRGSSSWSSRRRIRRSATSSVRRRASVGCAVSTGPTRARRPAPRRRRDRATAREARDGVADRIVDRPAARLAERGVRRTPDPLPLLGEVDELEVERERPIATAAARSRSSDAISAPSRSRSASGSSIAPVAAPEGDRASPDALDELEQVGPGLLRDHLAEECAEQPDLAGQRVARARRSRPRRLGGDRRKARCAGGFRGPAGPGGRLGHGVRMRERARARQQADGYGSTPRAPCRYPAATVEGSGDP